MIKTLSDLENVLEMLHRHGVEEAQLYVALGSSEEGKRIRT